MMPAIQYISPKLIKQGATAHSRLDYDMASSFYNNTSIENCVLNYYFLLLRMTTAITSPEL